MNINKKVAKEYIQEDLDSRSGAVSYDAIERNASNIEYTTSDIKFLVRGSETSLTNTILNKRPGKCPVCDPEMLPVTSMSESFQQSPFKNSPQFCMPISDTHTKIKCEECGGTGDVFCNFCGGSGFEECGYCSGNGYQEMQEPGEAWGGELSSANCQVCGGSGKVEYRKSCGSCDGTGSESCFDCNGDGRNPCQHCDETGYRHEYEAETSRIHRVIHGYGLPKAWSDVHREVAEALKLPHQKVTTDANSYELFTEKVSASFFSFKYGDNIHNVVTIITNNCPKVFWHPKNRHPETTYRRKLVDVKSRISVWLRD